MRYIFHVSLLLGYFDLFCKRVNVALDDVVSFCKIASMRMTFARVAVSASFIFSFNFFNRAFSSTSVDSLDFSLLSCASIDFNFLTSWRINRFCKSHPISAIVNPKTRCIVCLVDRHTKYWTCDEAPLCFSHPW